MNSNNLPNDPVILLSYINTQLRDNYKSFDDLCSSLNIDKESITNKLNSINYVYDAYLNKFI
ncbi:MAG: DUF4250 domain-containing protein [Eubacterium sp.]